MSGAVEFGKCEICGNDSPLERTYFRYEIKCECHSPNHFELVSHCKDCIPEEPILTIIRIKTNELKKYSESLKSFHDKEYFLNSIKKVLQELDDIKIKKRNAIDKQQFEKAAVARDKEKQLLTQINELCNMKTIKKVPVELVELNPGSYIPEQMEFGKLYYSPEFHGVNHLCLCGCGHSCYLPIKEGEWSINMVADKVTITPSILQRFDCKSHYIIVNGQANFV